MEKINDFANKKIIIVGIGRSGSRLALLLLKAGIKNILLIDRDVLEEKDRKDCPFFIKSKLHVSKSKEAVEILRNRFKDAKIEYAIESLNEDNSNKLLNGAFLICDCTDNWRARKIINDTINRKRNKKINFWIYSGAIRTKAMASVIQKGKTPCWQCWNSTKEVMVESCSQAGYDVNAGDKIAEVVCKQVLKIIEGNNGKLLFKLAEYDSKNKKIRIIRLKTNPKCVLCKGKDGFYTQNSLINPATISQVCGNEQFQIINKNKKINLLKIAKKFEKTKTVLVNDAVIVKFRNAQVVIFNNGRLLIRCKSLEYAKKLNKKICSVLSD